MSSVTQKIEVESLFDAPLPMAIKQGPVADEEREALDAPANGAVDLQELLGVTDEQVNDLYLRAIRYYESGSMVKAHHFLEKVRALNPYHQGAWRAIGAVYQEQDKLDDALDAYEYALALDPEDVVSSLFKGEVLLLLGRAEEALPILQEAIEHSADQPALEYWCSRVSIMLEAHLEPIS